jgi:hypothetical protein
MNHTPSDPDRAVTARERLGALALLGAGLVGCAQQPPTAPPAAHPLVGYYGCTGTNDATLGATGFLELRADGSCDFEFALTAKPGTSPVVREIFVDDPPGPVRFTGRWREGDDGLIELMAGQSANTPSLLLGRDRDHCLQLIGPCLSIQFAWTRPTR